jgi:hypothetical protein
VDRLAIGGFGVRESGNRPSLHDENRAVTAPPGEWSPGQRRLLKVLRISAAIGLLIVWSALIYVLIDTGGSHLMQPWQNRPQAWGVAYSLMYTAFFLNLMRTWHSPIARSARRPSYVLALQAFVISVGLIATLATLADLYYPPPMGSRVVGLNNKAGRRQRGSKSGRQCSQHRERHAPSAAPAWETL